MLMSMRKNKVKIDQLHFRVSPEEKETVAVIAKLAGVSVSGLLRDAVLGDFAGENLIKLRDQLKQSKDNFKS